MVYVSFHWVVGQNDNAGIVLSSFNNATRPSPLTTRLFDDE
jgi:hypothetical protein